MAHSEAQKLLKNKIPVFLAAGFLLLLFVLLFRNFLSGSAILMTTDAVISFANKSASAVFTETFSNWDSGVLLGLPRGSAMQIASFLNSFTSGIVWNNLVYGLACLAASFVFLAGFGKRLSPWAALCGALTAFWLGSNFTLIYAGHGLKPYVVLFFVCSVLSAGASSWRGGILWGGSVGLMFAQQPDVALFFALFAGVYLIFRLWQREGFKPVRWLKMLVPAAVVAFLFAGGPLLSGYKLNVKDTAQIQTETPQEKWEYITQWSWPPEETVAFIAPGYTGWRSGEPEGSYWGRMGRSAGWEQTRQGYMNFMMESTYIGFIPVAFALFALFACRRSPHRAEIIFWGGAALVALLLAFGKFFPLYSLFYKLPVINNIRNPNKFLQVFQMCLGILSAYGFDALFRQRSTSLKVESRKSTNADLRLPSSVRRPLTSDVCLPSSVLRTFFWCTAGVLGLLTLWALGVSLNQADLAAGFSSQGWPAEAARIIAANQGRSLWHAAFMAAVVAVVFAFFAFPQFEKFLRFRNWIAAGLIVLISADVLILSKHYVQPMPRSYIQANALTDFIKKNIGTQRVALLTQQSIYNIWLTYLLPYNQITAFNFSQMPRMPDDYKNLLTAGSKDPLRMWRFAAVKYLLGPAAFEKQLSAGQIKKVFAYNLAASPDNEIQLIPDPNGSHAVFELIDTVPRYALLGEFELASDEQTLARLAGNGSLLSGQGQGSAEVVRYRPGRVELKTQSESPVMLRVAERWDPDWKAEVDGHPAEVQKIDYLCQGVALTAGVHNVTLTYSPSRLFVYMQCAGYLALFAALLLNLSSWRNCRCKNQLP
jgi:hypothetical protein